MRSGDVAVQVLPAIEPAIASPLCDSDLAVVWLFEPTFH
jgi:hypothetical protein